MTDEISDYEDPENGSLVPGNHDNADHSDNHPTNSNHDNVVFTLQGPLSSGGGSNQHFHHHFHHRHAPHNDQAPVRFKDARAREKAEKLRDRLREKQLNAASSDMSSHEAFIVPCSGDCGPSTNQVQDPPESSSSEDAADEVLQMLISSISGLKVSDLTPTSAKVQWEETDIESCVYRLHLTEGKTSSIIDNTESPYCLKNLKPGTSYSVQVQARVSTITGDISPPFYFQTTSTEPSRPDAPRQGASSKTWLQVKWNAVSANGSPITHYTLTWDQGQSDWAELCRIPDRQFKVVNLNPGTRYSFRVSAINDIGESEQSDVGVCSTSVGVPGPPTCIYLGHSSETSLKICWSSPSQNGGAEVDSYMVEQETEYGFITVYHGDQQECTITDLLRSTNYRFRVFSGNVAGRSRPSVAATFTTRAGLPPSPRNVRSDGKERNDGIYLAWDPPSLEGEQEILRYNIKVSEVKSEESPTLDYHTIGECRLLVLGLKPGTLYRALTTVVTQGGEGPPSQPLIFKTRPVNPHAPNPPSLRTRPGSTSLSLQWGVPAYSGGSPVTKYALDMNIDAWNTIYTGSDTSFVVNGLQPGKSYKFRLRCFNSAGSSLYSNPVAHQTGPAVPVPPPGLTVQTRGPHAALFTWLPAEPNGSPVTGYSLEVCRVGEKFRELYSGTGTSCILKDLAAGTGYIAMVKALNKVGYSLPSEPVSYTSPPAPPSIISKVLLEVNSDTHLEITWPEPESAGSELLYYNVCFNGTISKVEECYFRVDNLHPGTTYKVRVQAVNTVGAGPFTSVFNIATLMSLPPILPGDIVLQNTGHNFLKLSWTTVKSLKRYRVERKSKFDAHFVEAYEGPKAFVKMAKLQPNTLYEVRVAGANDAGVGPWLNASFKTDPVPPPSILKVWSSLSDTSLTVTWSVKEQLRESEVFQLFESVGGESFIAVYEGTQLSQLRNLPKTDTSYRYRIRVKRDENQVEYGPYSQTITISVKAPTPSPTDTPEGRGKKAVGEVPVDTEESEEEKKVMLMIFGLLCFPALLIILYFVYVSY